MRGGARRLPARRTVRTPSVEPRTAHSRRRRLFQQPASPSGPSERGQCESIEVRAVAVSAQRIPEAGCGTGARSPAEDRRVALKVHNTMTRRKEDLVPAVPGQIRMYVCGVTVYDNSHIGHARSAIVFDVIRRYLRFKGFQVRFVKNYTDVDDRIIRRANAEGVSAREISERYIAEDRTDMASLGVLPPDVAPKATEHIAQMIALIEHLMGKGLAYPVDGDVYFEVQRFPAYGRLSGKNLDELLAGARDRKSVV